MESTARFDTEYLRHVGIMREKFFRTGSLSGITGVRQEILACWETYYIFNQTNCFKKDRVTEAEFACAVEKSKALISVAGPYMQLLYSFLKDDSFWITLVDNTGVVLKLVGSPKMLKVAEATDLVEGSYRGADSSYPGLFYACLQLEQPFQIVSTEHPSEIDDIIAGSASPIYENGTERCLGVIGISGYWQNSHDHTLGLAILAAEAISQQLALKEQNESVLETNQKLTTALEAIDSGAIYFQSDGIIAAANLRAQDMLGSDEKVRLTGQSVFAYTGTKITQETFKKIEDKIRKNGVFHCDIIPAKKYNSLHCTIRSVAGHRDAYFMQLQRSTDLNKIVADLVFSQAPFTFKDIIGESISQQATIDAARIAAKHDPAVLITGESGTGKEMFAQAIHNASPRANGPFVAINCGAIPKSLIESELFGYESGAFTGAQKGGQIGKFELANKGTIFLDEIGDMPYEIQVALLRVLQTREVIRIGGRVPIKIDVRIISATNQNLEKRIAENTFRQDLYYRLNVMNLRLPPLRERKDDIHILCNHFLQKYGYAFDKRVSGISPEALEVMKAYCWPGNIRELENTIERAVVLCKGAVIGTEDLPIQIRGLQFSPPDIDIKVQTQQVISESAEKRIFNRKEQDIRNIEDAIKASEGNLSEAARLLGMSRATLYRKLKEYGIQKKVEYLKQSNHLKRE